MGVDQKLGLEFPHKRWVQFLLALCHRVSNHEFYLTEVGIQRQLTSVVRRLVRVNAPRRPGAGNIYGVGKETCLHFPIEVALRSPPIRKVPHTVKDRTPYQKLGD